MTSKFPKIFRSIGLMALFLASSVALSADSFPGYSPDRDLIKTQKKVDALFEKGDFERAIKIYRDDLAPRGDKFAQYMVGYMYYSGRGVPADRPRASAWYRLSAERGEESFVKVRDVLEGILTGEQRAQADQIYAELRREMGDIVLVIALVNQDLDVLVSRRGDQGIFGSDIERGNYGHNLSIYNTAADRLEEHVNYLDELVNRDQSISDEERSRLDILMASARREIDGFRASVN